MLGGARLALAEGDVARLRHDVTSPGGTTEAALQVLASQQNRFPELIDAAVQAAARRSRELSE